VKNIPARFHLDPIWNDGALGFFEERRPNKKKNKNNKMSSDMGSVPDPKPSPVQQKPKTKLVSVCKLLFSYSSPGSSVQFSYSIYVSRSLIEQNRIY